MGAKMAGGRTTTIFMYIPAFPFCGHSIVCSIALRGAFLLALPVFIIKKMKKK
ncbi:MAG: hypothetical protein IIX15_05120 [Clostridia bacterium]|nr:hypothetical protein [Clostridia bacterium]